MTQDKGYSSTCMTCWREIETCTCDRSKYGHPSLSTPYRTQDNPFALAVAAARQAVEMRDAAHELDWQRGRAEAVAALRDFAEVVAPAVMYLRNESQMGEVDIDDARSGRVSLCVRSPNGHVWVARHLCEIVWSPGQGRWLRVSAPVGEDDGTLSAILLRVVNASDFGDHLSAVTSARDLDPGTELVRVGADTVIVCPREPRWYTRPANYILPAASILVSSYVVWVYGGVLGLWST